MKYRTTCKAIREKSANIVCAGYCDLQNLLHDTEPSAYTVGVYGWNFDVYEVDGLTICTGYRGMPGRRANNIAEYERRAREIRNDYNDEHRAEKLQSLLHEFAAQA